MGCPGHDGGASPAAVSLNVNTKSSGGESGALNSQTCCGGCSGTDSPACSSNSAAIGSTLAPGRTPALKAWNCPPPIELAMASAIWPRAVFLCDRKRMRNGCASIDPFDAGARSGNVGRRSCGVSVAQHSPALDEGDDLGDTLPRLEVREHEGPFAAHLARIAVHDLERRTD